MNGDALPGSLADCGGFYGCGGSIGAEGDADGGEFFNGAACCAAGEADGIEGSVHRVLWVRCCLG